MRRAINFYSTVFEANLFFESPGWSTFKFDEFELALHILSPSAHDESFIPNAGLNLLVESIEAFQVLIEQHGGKLRKLREPDEFVPVRVASFYDSEGNGFELRQTVGNVVAT